MTTIAGGSNAEFNLKLAEPANADTHFEKAQLPGEVYVTYILINACLMPLQDINSRAG